MLKSGCNGFIFWKLFINWILWEPRVSGSIGSLLNPVPTTLCVDTFQRHTCNERWQTLNLSHLSLERVKPTTFKYLSSLEVLDLSYNKLNHLYPPAIGYLPRLKQLWLAGEYTLPVYVLVFFNSFFQKCFHPKHGEIVLYF